MANETVIINGHTISDIENVDKPIVSIDDLKTVILAGLSEDGTNFKQGSSGLLKVKQFVDSILEKFRKTVVYVNTVEQDGVYTFTIPDYATSVTAVRVLANGMEMLVGDHYTITDEGVLTTAMSMDAGTEIKIYAYFLDNQQNIFNESLYEQIQAQILNTTDIESSGEGYIRFKNGTQICWGNYKQASNGSSIKIGSNFYCGLGGSDINFPLPFKEPPETTARILEGGKFPWVSSFSTTKIFFGHFYLLSCEKIEIGDQFTITYIAIGKWK